MSGLVMQRRRFLAGSLASVAVASPFGIVRGAPVTFGADPYTLGVASGAPREDSVILWTRLAPRPLEEGGMTPAPVEVEWQVAEDEGFTRIAARGVERATAELAHSIHAEAKGLRPGRIYWYRFRAGSAVSPVGRTRTAPVGSNSRFRFAFASCQQYEQGYYTAYRDMAARDLDLVVHLGDYIYEKSWGTRHVREHGVGIPTTLAEFRNRYALYKSDADLQAAHAAFPWLSIWDDHEVADDYANDRSYTTRDPQRFLKIRTAAYQAYYEHMPLPPSARPIGPNATIYAHYRFGDMLDLLLLDDRQYRSAPACVKGGRPTTVADCEERTEEARTMLGGSQERWFDARLGDRRGRWTIVAQQTLMAETRRKDEEGGDRFWMDGWDGYPNARRRLLDSIVTHKVRNPVVIGGDRHAYFAANLKRDFSRPREATIAAEFVGTSITSDGPGESSVRNALAGNPGLVYANGEKRGYAVVALDVRSCTVGFEALDDVKDAHSAVRRLATFAVEDGVPGVKAA
ncbi:alkaline phosphatase [Bradyrhizobium lablabi]|uniref:Alkaline phosphatase n=1 Tax=Bradyrhizobium lablabi TaxID=722472 RepID=A0A0R3MNM1_9BRAD|nr:alkaline phosphatase D family protein [Bradyrhizobium lablabi]KRR21537.1 alkaline phosphatase [Bradyrhizobium lablabi]